MAAALAAAAALLAPAAPASAHGGCNVYAYEPVETVIGSDQVIAGLGTLSCTETHDPATYQLTVCLYHTPVTPPGDIAVGGDVPVPPTARLVACTTGSPSYVHANGGFSNVYTGCPYVAGYYRTYVSDGRAAAHVNLTTKTARSDWVFIDGTACL